MTFLCFFWYHWYWGGVALFQHNLLGMAAVAQLKEDPKYSAVYELLHIFSVEKLGEYLAFHEVRFLPPLTPLELSVFYILNLI